MTEEEQKADDLTAQLKFKVHPIVLAGPDDTKIIGFIKEPSRLQKMAVLDKADRGMISAGGELLDVVILKEHSDPRIYSERSEDDQYYIAAALAGFATIKIAAHTLKKK